MDGEMGGIYLCTGVLLWTRMAAAIRLTPFLGGRPLPILPVLGLALAISMSVTPLVINEVARPIGVGPWFWAILGELAVGASFGLMARISFLALESAGDLASLATRFSTGEASGEGGSRAPLSSLYVLFGTGSFLLMGGHRALIEILAGSARAIPPGAGFVDGGHLAGFLQASLGLFQSAFSFGVMIAAPLFVAGLFSNVLTGLMSRMAPGASQVAGAQVFQTALVQLVLIAVLGAGVTAGVAFLGDSLAAMGAAVS